MNPGDKIRVTFDNMTVNDVNDEGFVKVQSPGGRFYEIDTNYHGDDFKVEVTESAPIPEPPIGTIVRCKDDKRNFYLRTNDGQWVFTCGIAYSIDAPRAFDKLCTVESYWNSVQEAIRDNSYEIV